MIFPGSYTVFSYVDYTVGSGGITTGTTVFPFAKQFLQLDHLKVYHKLGSAPTTWNLISSSNYAATGSSGSGVITVNGGFPARTNGDSIRILRVTPDTLAGRLVDFQAGSLASADLDSSAIQALYISEEMRDQTMLVTVVLQSLPATLYGAGYTWQSV